MEHARFLNDATNIVIKRFILFYYYFILFYLSRDVDCIIVRKQDLNGIFHYPLNERDTGFVVSIKKNSSVTGIITHVDTNYSDFLVVQLHSQIYDIALKYFYSEESFDYAVGTNSALVIHLQRGDNLDIYISLENGNNEDVAVLFFVRNYTYKDPIPGALHMNNSSESFSHPYLTVQQNLLTTMVSIHQAAMIITYDRMKLQCGNEIYCSNNDTKSISSEVQNGFTSHDLAPSLKIKYLVYLSYLYEGDLSEEQYWKIIFQTSTVEGLQKYSQKVSEISPATEEDLWLLFVSYSGVGAIVNVAASYNGSHDVLYSCAFFYGCNFIPEEEYKCTKLVSTLDQLLCGCLPFLGLLFLLTGHRWLNFTMFMSGFLGCWFLLFIAFVNISNADMRAIGFGTMFGAIIGGITWLIIWHRFHRPFFSALLLILISAFFSAMISTHFLKYAMIPTRHNIAAFVMLPIAFGMLVISYSIFDIKKVHILSCSLLGSYLMIVPFAFYFGSSLTYIVINVVSVMVISGYSRAIGFPPFQYCDIVLLCLWVSLFLFGSGYQFYRERSGPPFHPPNVSSFSLMIRGYASITTKVISLFRSDNLTSCRRRRGTSSDYEDFQSVSSQDNFASDGSSRSDRWWNEVCNGLQNLLRRRESVDPEFAE